METEEQRRGKIDNRILSVKSKISSFRAVNVIKTLENPFNIVLALIG